MAQAASAGDKMPEFQLVEKFISGFVSKLRPDEVDPGSAVEGSFNFILDDDGKWRTRPGTEYLGRVSTDTSAVTSVAILRRRDGVQLPIIFYSTVAEYYSPGKADWTSLMASLTANSPWGSDGFDLTADNVNRLAMCNGYDTYRTWSGATAMFLSATVNTVTVTGSTTLANLGFSTTGSFRLDSTTYTYTGLSSMTFTGVTTDASLGGHTTLTSAITQAHTAYGSAPLGNVLISSPNSRILMGSIIPSGSIYGGGQVRGSKTSDPTDFTFSGTRLANEGFTVTVPEGGDTVRGMVIFERSAVILKKFSITTLRFSTDGNDTPILDPPLIPYDNKSSGDVGSVSPRCVFHLGQEIFFVSQNNVVSSLKRVQGYDFPLPFAYSDPIKKTIDGYLFDTDSAGAGWRGRAFFSAKSSSSVTKNDRQLTFNSRYNAWDTPWQGFGLNDYFEKDGRFYGALNDSPNVIRLWTGTTDLKSTTSAGFPINSKLVLPRLLYGQRALLKQFQKIFFHGEMEETGSVTFRVTYTGATGSYTRSVTIAGTEAGFFVQEDTSVFGSDDFGAEVFGGGGMGSSASSAGEMRVYLSTTKLPFYDIQVTIETSSYFKLFAYGPAVSKSPAVLPPSRMKALA